jgi:hypothetical protein
MLPEEIKHQSLHVTKQKLARSKEYSKDTIEGTRLDTIDNITKYQEQTKAWRDNKVIRREIQSGYLVLMKKANAETCGKLNSKWEGSYVAIAANRRRAFHLTDGEGRAQTSTWNVGNL